MLKNQVFRLCTIFFMFFALDGYAAEKFLVPPEHIAALAKKLAYTDFPKNVDILAIARIESTYNEDALNPEIGSVGPSVGVMQVQNGHQDLHRNMFAGVGLLREYYMRLGSREAAVKSYNIGIGTFRQGKSKISADEYYAKFVKRRQELVKYYARRK